MFLQLLWWNLIIKIIFSKLHYNFLLLATPMLIATPIFTIFRSHDHMWNIFFFNILNFCQIFDFVTKISVIVSWSFKGEKCSYLGWILQCSHVGTLPLSWVNFPHNICASKINFINLYYCHCLVVLFFGVLSITFHMLFEDELYEAISSLKTLHCLFSLLMIYMLHNIYFPPFLFVVVSEEWSVYV